MDVQPTWSSPVTSPISATILGPWACLRTKTSKTRLVSLLFPLGFPVKQPRKGYDQGVPCEFPERLAEPGGFQDPGRSEIFWRGHDSPLWPFPLGFWKCSRKKDPWKEWGRYPKSHRFLCEIDNQCEGFVQGTMTSTLLTPQCSRALRSSVGFMLFTVLR